MRVFSRVVVFLVMAAPAAGAEEGRLGGGERHEQKIVLRAGELLALEAVQDGIDLVLAVDGPGGVHAEIDSPTGTSGSESLRFVASRAGEHTISVHALEADAPPGRYTLRLVERRKANARDKRIFEAQTLLGRAWALRQELRQAEAMPLAERALALHMKTYGPLARETLEALSLRGYLRDEVGDYAGGEKDFARVLAASQKTFGPEARETQTARSNLAFLNLMGGDYAEAKRLFDETIAVRERTGGRTDDALQGLGDLYLGLGDLEKAEDHYRRALALREAGAGGLLEAARGSIGVVLVERGQLDEGETMCDAAARALAPRRGFAQHSASSARQCVAEARLRRGDAADALTRFTEVRDARTRLLGPSHPFVARALVSVGRAALAAGDHAGAREALERAVVIFDKTWRHPHPTLGAALVALAAVEAAAGTAAAERKLLERAVRIFEAAAPARRELREARERLQSLGS